MKTKLTRVQKSSLDRVILQTKSESEIEQLRLAAIIDRLRARLKDERKRHTKAIEQLTKMGIFVANADGTFTCEDCLSPELKARLGDEDVQVWEEGSHGWTGPIACHECKLSLPVYVDANDVDVDAEETSLAVWNDARPVFEQPCLCDKQREPGWEGYCTICGKLGPGGASRGANLKPLPPTENSACYCAKWGPAWQGYCASCGKLGPGGKRPTASGETDKGARWGEVQVAAEVESKIEDWRAARAWVIERAVALNKSGRPGPSFADAIARAEYDAELAIIDELRTLLVAW